jgi:hypothetical protein
MGRRRYPTLTNKAKAAEFRVASRGGLYRAGRQNLAGAEALARPKKFPPGVNVPPQEKSNCDGLDQISASKGKVPLAFPLPPHLY